MILDSSHKRWLVGTLTAGSAALGLYVWLSWDAPDGLGGGSQVGLAYGIAGGGLILFAWLLTALRYVPKWWWIGSRAFWLKGHIWLGLLSAVLILCHSGGRFGGTFERILYIVFGLTLLTGVIGLGLQQFLPRLLTERVAVEVPYDQIPEICDKLCAAADQEVKKVQAAKPSASAVVVEWYEDLVRPFLSWPMRTRSLRDPARAAESFALMRGGPAAAAEPSIDTTLRTLEQFCHERRLLDEQERLQFWLHAWLYLHVPLSAAMVILAAAHAVMALYY